MWLSAQKAPKHLDMDGASAAMLNMLAEKLMQPAVNPRHMAYCPTMDMIALATVDEKVHIFRLNGQKVFSVSAKQVTAKVNYVKWKPNGENNSTYLCELACGGVS